MNYLKIKTIVLAVSLTLLASCGGESGNVNKKPIDNQPVVNFSVSPQATAYIGEPKTIPVTASGTDFTVSPINGAGCVKGGGGIVCTPTAVGDHTVTLTATVDSRTVSLTIKVPEAELGGTGLKSVGDGDFELEMFADETESEPISLYASGDWTAEVDGDPSWISLIDATEDIKTSSIVMIQAETGGKGGTQIGGGRGMVSIAVALEPNYSGAERRATITFTIGNTGYTIAVIQSATAESGENLGESVSISIDPATATVTAGQSRTFEVTAVNTGFSFAVVPASGHGCVKSGGNVVCTPTFAGTYEITVTATENTSKTDSATLTVASVEVSISISPATATIESGANRTFEVTALNTAYTFSVSPDSGHGCNTYAGNIRCSPTSPDTYTITVTATEDSTKTATATFTAKGSVIVEPPPPPPPAVSISISPKSTEAIELEEDVEFTVTIENTENTDFSFSVSPDTGHGCVKNDMIVTCTPTLADFYTLTVTADADFSKKDSVTFEAVEGGGSFFGIKPEELNIDLGDGTVIDMRLVEAGTFLMGCEMELLPDKSGAIMGNYYVVGFESLNKYITTVGIEGWLAGFSGSYCTGTPSPENRHQVTLTEDYYIGKYEVTQAQWKAVMGDFPRTIAAASLGDYKPMVNVSHTEVLDFIAALNALDAGNGREWRLPTEAEWDYAAKGGNKESFCKDESYTCMFSGSNSFDNVAWSGTPISSGGSVKEVGLLGANELGLYDMTGNAGEMVMDFSSKYSSEPQTDPKGPETGTNIVIRGGGVNTGVLSNITVFYRNQGTPASTSVSRGFRLALTVIDEETEP